MASRGFTIVELLIVVVVIAILAAITIVSYNGITARATESKIVSDMRNISMAINIAREQRSDILLGVTGTNNTAGACSGRAIDLAEIPKTDNCWFVYNRTLDRISEASGMNIRSIVDPWGRPYMIDENQGEAFSTQVPCERRDVIAMYAKTKPPATVGISYEHHKYMDLVRMGSCANY